MNINQKLFKALRYSLLTAVVIVGLVTIIGTGGSDNGNGGTEQPELAEYQPGNPASLNTSPATTSVISDGRKAKVKLDDDSKASIPELPEAFEATLQRSSTEDDTSLSQAIQTIENKTGYIPTGSTRSLIVEGSGDAADLKPVITIPQKEAGSINLETVNVLRFGNVLIDGEMIENHAMLLPVSLDENGDLFFIDPLMADGLIAKDKTRQSQLRSTVSRSNTQYEWVGSVRYVLMTFQDDLNWKRQPRLERMIPDASGASKGFRRPAGQEERKEMAKVPICNLVILVHGHNEEEKAGAYTPSAESPWLFSYKRKVWDLFYEEIMAEFASAALYHHECTAFYEFIYPTYRPIFSPVSDKTGKIHKTLGESLGRLIEEELQADPQLAAMMRTDMPFNVFVVAHSQGGLVARAGFRHMPLEFKERVRRFVSWGTPHHGAALYTLRYALQAGHDMVIDGVRLPLQNIQNNMITGPLVEGGINAHIALDTPGTRDLRWEAAQKDKVAIQKLFPTIDEAASALIEPSLFSENLSRFNASHDEENRVMGTPYTFIYGTTPKTAELDMVDVTGGWWFQFRRQQVLRFADSSGIEKGAALNRLVMQSGYNQGDGAVPIYSQRGQGIYVHQMESIQMTDVDHEEFYGAEAPQRSPATIYKGRLTAGETFNELRLDHSSRKCPQMEVESETTDQTLFIDGRVVYPLYDTANISIGDGIDRIEARSGSRSGDVIPSLRFTHQADGSFSGQGIAEEGAYVVVAVFKDGSELVMDAEVDEDAFTQLLEGRGKVEEYRSDLRDYEELMRVRDVQVEVRVIADGKIERTDLAWGGSLSYDRDKDTTVSIVGEFRPVDGTDWVTSRAWNNIREVETWDGRTAHEGYQGEITGCNWTLEKRRGVGNQVFDSIELGDVSPLPINLDFPKPAGVNEWFLDFEISGKCSGYQYEWRRDEETPRYRELTFDLPRYRFRVKSLM